MTGADGALLCVHHTVPPDSAASEARLMPLAPPPARRIPGRLRSQGPLSNPDALLEPMAADELANWDEGNLLPEAHQP
jgi:hypothetical protein